MRVNFRWWRRLGAELIAAAFAASFIAAPWGMLCQLLARIERPDQWTPRAGPATLIHEAPDPPPFLDLEPEPCAAANSWDEF